MRTLILLLASLVAFSDEKPAPVTDAQKVEVLQLTRKAYVALQRVMTDRNQILQAQIDQKEAEKELKELNEKIEVWRKQVRELCRADEKHWDINDDFEWIERKQK
jgi:hypothetical protein